LEQALEWASMATPPKSDDGNVEAARRKREALAALEANPRARRVRPDERVPDGTVEITIGGWIPGSRGKRGAPGREKMRSQSEPESGSGARPGDAD
jgi:hypothetical protein